MPEFNIRYGTSLETSAAGERTVGLPMPSRMQRRRSRGWRQPINAIYVGRPTKWGNPYKVGTGHHTPEQTVRLYRRDLLAGSLPFTIDDVRRELKGQDLICWCKPDAPCHADVLLAMANF
jgi:hypothetical protein